MKRCINIVLYWIVISVLTNPFAVDAQKRDKKKKRWEPIVETRALLLSDSLPFEQAVSDLFDDYCKSTMCEKLYLRTDKESCLLGDTIWFTAYLTSAVTNLPVDYSRFMYIDIVDRSDSVFHREKIGRPDSVTYFTGYIPIHESLRQGEYFLRAYTYWQQNDDEAFIYKKRIRLINPFDHKIKSNITVERAGEDGKRVLSVSFVNHLNERYDNVKFHYYIPTPNGDNIPILANTGYNGRCRIVVDDPYADKIWLKFSIESNWDFEGYEDIPGTIEDFDVQFFPEGGAFINGFSQRIGFKSVGRDGRAVPVNGAIYDNNGKRVTSISSNELGMGVIELLADSSITYIAKLKNAKGNEKTFQLPVAEEGIALSVDCSKDKISYNILSDEKYNHLVENCFVLMHSRGLLFYALPANKYSNISLDVEPVPEGIIHVILCDTLGNTYSERLCYHYSDRYADVDIGYNGSLSNDNSRRAFPIALKYMNDNNETANISVSVINTGKGVVDESNGGIEAYQYLTSDLKGYIESPGFYYNTSNNQRQKGMEALMLTQGWSRFDVSNLLKNNVSISNEYYMERGPFISGRVKRLLSKKTTAATVVLTGYNGASAKIETDEDGSFVLDNLWYDKGTVFVVQAYAKDKMPWNLEVLLDATEFKKYSLNSYSYSLMNDDKKFYNKYAKNYVFADNGERISTLGSVSVKSFLRLTPEQMAIKLSEDRSRESFMRGINTIESYGTKDERKMYHFISEDLEPQYSYSTSPKAFNFFISLDHAMGLNPLLRQMTLETPEGVRVIVDKWKRERVVLKENSPIHSYDIRNEDAFQILGSKVSLYNMARVGDAKFQYLVDNTVTPYKEYSWDKQIIIPFAPQKPSLFYKPSYENLTELQKDKIDEKITRYWLPNINLKSDDRYLFTFPTAARGENYNYLLVIEGVTEKGEPIYKVEKLVF